MNRREVIKSLTIGVITPNMILNASTTVHPVAEVLPVSKHRPNEILWFRQPGKFWNSQAIHIGNGFLGLSFLGGVNEEIFSVTEKSLWTGGPGEYANYNYGIKEGSHEYLAEIRKLIISNDRENLKRADQLNREHFLGDGQGYGHFSAFGRMALKFNHDGKAYKNYTRRLDLSQSIASVAYEVNGIQYTREYFCSYPDKVAVLSFTSGKKKALSFILTWDVFQKDHHIRFENNILTLSGKTNGNARAFSLKMQLRYTSGTVFLKDGVLHVENTDQISFILTAGTEYMPVMPFYNGADPDQSTTQQLNAVHHKTLVELRKNHIADYTQLYDRVTLAIPAKHDATTIPTDERWRSYAQGVEDPGLKVLYFNLSRYLLISSSRPGSLPANLQGGWNMFEAAQWSGNYQSNINVQLNYSSAGSTNLLECQRPYIEWIKGLVKPGTEVAKAYYQTQGWVSHSIGNVWGYAAPGFELEWGMYPAAAAWHCHYIWKHYTYSHDKKYLEEQGYPVLKGASIFWLQNLVVFKDYLITAPSGSAEHGVLINAGTLQATGSSFDQDILNVPCNFQDIEMVGELFGNTIKAAGIVGTDVAFIEQLKKAKSKLMPLKVGQYGQLQEWYEDADTPACNHRHIGHLYAVWPAKQIAANDTVLAAAARQTLNMRGEVRNYSGANHKDIYTAANWSLGLRMACWLRLQDAERANKIFTQLITQAGFENLMTYQHVPTQANEPTDVEVFQAEGQTWLPVWQIDTSLALAGFIAEMFLQTNAADELILLPALPKEWPTGKITGLKAEGNLTVDLEWAAMKIVKYTIYATQPSNVKVWIGDRVSEISATVKAS